MKRKAITLLLLLLVCCSQAFSHVIKYELERLETGEVITKYLGLGFTHIIPLGFDHVLFILCIFFLNTDIKKIILQASMFTLAHSITLGLAAYGYINPPANIIEPLIAISIVLLALENVFNTSDKVKSWRMVMVFAFGLVHGMGFAGALHELGLPRYAFFKALISFNVGVELGQLAIIVAMYLLVAKVFAQRTWYRARIVIPASVIIALIATYWTIERIFFTS